MLHFKVFPSGNVSSSSFAQTVKEKIIVDLRDEEWGSRGSETRLDTQALFPFKDTAVLQYNLRNIIIINSNITLITLVFMKLFFLW